MESKNLIASKETPYFVLSVIVSVFIYIIALFSIIGIGIAVLLLGIVLFSNAIMIGSIRGNGVRIHEKQFPEIYERVVSLSEAMNLKKSPMFLSFIRKVLLMHLRQGLWAEMWSLFIRKYLNWHANKPEKN